MQAKPETADCFNEDQFESLYRTYYPKLTAFATLFLKNGDAHDIVQEVFIDLLENRRSVGLQTLNAYLYKAVHYKCIDHIRHRYVEEQYASETGRELLRQESDYFTDNLSEVESALFSGELQQKVDEIIESFPPRKREVFKLNFIHRKPAREIAAILDMSVSTVENHLYDAMKILREKVARYLLTLFLFCFAV
jgi:RNA polymerase sigma-70 factor (ECF subfamily)